MQQLNEATPIIEPKGFSERLKKFKENYDKFSKEIDFLNDGVQEAFHNGKFKTDDAGEMNVIYKDLLRYFAFFKKYGVAVKEMQWPEGD